MFVGRWAHRSDPDRLHYSAIMIITLIVHRLYVKFNPYHRSDHMLVSDMYMQTAKLTICRSSCVYLAARCRKFRVNPFLAYLLIDMRCYPENLT